MIKFFSREGLQWKARSRVVAAQNFARMQRRGLVTESPTRSAAKGHAQIIILRLTL